MAVEVPKKSKWDPHYEDPFTVVRRDRGGSYILRDELGLLKKQSQRTK